MNPPTQVVCVTPVRNEAWILERFLACAAVWADHIIIADQGSDDGSREIAARAERTTLIDNPGRDYDEGARQRLLLDAARALGGRRHLLVALDADEALSANVVHAPEWEALKAAPIGTVGRFDWANLLPDLRGCWIPSAPIPFAFMDDGTAHGGECIHSTRLPTPAGAGVVDITGVKVLHFQHMAWRRMQSKQRWYQCWEALHNPQKRPIQIYRQYHRMDAFPRAEIAPIAEEWLADYERRGIEMTLSDDRGHTWDAEVLAWMAEHGPRRFSKLAIWDFGWEALARSSGSQDPMGVRDPRSGAERIVHRLLAATQPHAHRRAVRLAQRALAAVGW